MKKRHLKGILGLALSAALVLTAPCGAVFAVEDASDEELISAETANESGSDEKITDEEIVGEEITDEEIAGEENADEGITEEELVVVESEEEEPAEEEVTEEEESSAEAEVEAEDEADPLLVSNSGKCGANVSWSYNASTKTITLTGKGPTYDYTMENMPEYIKEDDFIGHRWDTEKIVVGEGITTIGNYLFYDMGYKSVSLPGTITSIGTEAFAYSREMSTINIPSSVKSIGKGAFSNTGITKLVIPEGVSIIRESTFEVCEALSEITIPSSVKTIEKNAFDNYYNDGEGEPVISDVYYKGTKDMYEKISIGTNNNMLTKAKNFHFEAAKFSVSFKYGSPASLSVESGKTIGSANKNKLPTPKRKGYTCNGKWYTSATGGTAITASTKVTKNVTYYAHWTKVSVKAPTITKLTPKSKAFAISWKKAAGAKGYEIRYSTKSTMKGYSTKTVAASKSFASISKLKKNKRYYVQVVAYKLDSTKSKVYKASVKKNVTTK